MSYRTIKTPDVSGSVTVAQAEAAAIAIGRPRIGQRGIRKTRNGHGFKPPFGAAKKRDFGKQIERRRRR